MSDDPMRILVVEPTKDPYVKEIDGSLTSMQAIVGGFIQAVEPFEDPNVLLLCNEEAKLLGLPVGCLKYAFKNCLKECGIEPYPKKVQTKPPQRKETGYER